ncbi:hypothetical protein IQ05_01237 [Flavobacterium tiangeerense]|uniref:Cyclophilin-like domain-containing protein n=1 Tax=Flavobacterium tiangeerense TaxID=459471 RepID=A0ABY3FKR3_9FLAO|nr:cyclophilin-like fold protein [Flavobacterium tiangeerense]TWI00581.1 hypothetical protein IQ05_01237 [Flavobacterium tiangeerense]
MNHSVQHKVKITIQGKIVTATLDNSKTSKDFISLLPLQLILEDYAKTEKISNLPKKLTTEDAPIGSKPLVGDIALYAPWGNLAIFYKDFHYANGLIVFGKIDTGIEIFKVPASMKAIFELLE